MNAKHILMAALAALAVFSCSKRDVIPPEPEAINYEIAWLPNIVQIVEDVLANMGKE